MQLGWIDFSKTDRDKILTVLELLTEKGTLDELGIASVRDSFSDLFFPGTSTIQTRAKYFFLVPYALCDLRKGKNETDFIKLRQKFDNIEEKCAHILDKDSKGDGIIGKVAINNHRWVRRTPANIYWAGLRKYGIIRYNFSIDDCIKIIISEKLDKKNNSGLGNKTDVSEGSSDDKFAMNNKNMHLINLPSYDENWIEDVDINLSYEEGQFLKNQIISNCPDTMLSFILKNDFYDVLECESFGDLRIFIDKFPQEIRENYYNAFSFSEFVFALRVLYNVIVSDGQNSKANEFLRELNLKEISKIDIIKILSSLNIEDNKLKEFLIESRQLMEEEKIDELKVCISNREVYLKGINRSKTKHPGEFDSEAWFGGYELDYRFSNAKRIIEDIRESENINMEVIEDVES